MRHTLTPLCLLVTALACSTAGGAKPPASTTAAPKGAHAGTAPPAAPAPAASSGRALPAASTSIELAGLEPEAKTFFEKVSRDELCPCDCPKSFGACMAEGSKCKPARMLGSWIVDQLEKGAPNEALAEPLTRELSGGFTSPVKTPDLNGFSSKGPQNARFTLVEYADFECSHCKLASDVVDALVEKYPDQVRVVFKHFPLTFHAMAKKAAIAAEAAGRQGKFWEMHHALFRTQEILDDDLIRGHAKALSLDVARFEKDLKDPALAARVEASRKEAEGYGVNATPAFLVNGRPYFLPRTVEAFELRFAMEDARAQSSCQ